MNCTCDVLFYPVKKKKEMTGREALYGRGGSWKRRGIR
jgi:hypothetical protein